MTGTDTNVLYVLFFIVVAVIIVAMVAKGKKDKPNNHRSADNHDNGYFRKAGIIHNSNSSHNASQANYDPLLMMELQATMAELTMDLNTLEIKRQMKEVARKFSSG